MSFSDGHLHRPRRPVLPPLSTRTLHHPSFLPLYAAAGFARHRGDRDTHTAHPIDPAEVFYTDPAMCCGRRIHNIVSDFGGFECLQLNAPPPVMSACLAPPARPDPFRSGPHPTRNLGSPRWSTDPVRTPSQRRRAVLQLSQEEDQAVTNLLKLHHQRPRQSDQALHPGDVPYPGKAGLGRAWSDMELEAADTLLTRFSLAEDDGIWSQRHHELAVTLPDPLPNQHDGDLARSTETHQGPEALPALKASNSTQKDTGENRFTCVSEDTEPDWKGFRSAEDRGRFSEVRERMLSDPEGDAVHVLLSLGDTGTLDNLQ